MREIYSNYKNRRAFTLIELMVVVAIIGILATMIVINLQGAQAKSRDTKRKSDLSMIMSAIVMYGSDNGGAFPASDDLIEITPATGSGLNLVIAGGYIDSMPKDPKCGTSSCAAAATKTGYLYYRGDINRILATTGATCGTAGSSRKGSVYASLEKPSTEDTATILSAFDICVRNGMHSHSQTTDGTHINFKLSN